MSIFDSFFKFVQPSATPARVKDFQDSEQINKVQSNTPAFGQDAFDFANSNVLELGSWSFLNSTNLEYTLKQFQDELNSSYLEESIAELIDYAVAKVAPISNIYTKHVDFADTPVILKKIKLQGYSEAESKNIYYQALEKIVRLYPDCNTERDVCNFRIGRLFKDGVFASQKWYNPITGVLEQIKLIPPQQLRWKNIEEFVSSPQASKLVAQGYSYYRDWLPYQRTVKGGDIYIHPKGFLYKPLFPIVTDKGKFFIPPLLAAIAHLPAYQMFNKSIENIGKNVGYHKQLRVLSDPATLELLAKYPDVEFPTRNEKTNKSELKPLVVYAHRAAQVLKDKINKVLKTAIIAVAPGLKIEEGSNFDVPSSLQDMKDLILAEMVVGAKSYMNIVGYPGQVNQTTLAETQKQALKNQIESLQAANLSIHKHDLFAQLGADGYIVEEWEAEHEPVSFDTDVQMEAARKLKLENDDKEKALNISTQTNTNLETE